MLSIVLEARGSQPVNVCPMQAAFLCMSTTGKEDLLEIVARCNHGILSSKHLPLPNAEGYVFSLSVALARTLGSCFQD